MWVCLRKCGFSLSGSSIIRSLCSFIMYKTGGVKLMEPSCHGSMIDAESALIAQPPEADAGMIFVALSHTLCAVEKSGTPFSIGGKGSPKSMGLAVSLIHHIDTGTVTEFIPTGMIGIVTGTYGIDM